MLLAGCGGTASTQVPEPDRPGRAVVAHDLASGKLLWRKEVQPPSVATEPVLVAGVVLVPGDGLLVAYDARGGQRLWSSEGLQGLPQVAGDVLVVEREQDVQAVEPRTGRSLWRVARDPAERLHAGPGGVALVSDRLPGPPHDLPPATPAPERPGGVRLLTLAGTEAWRVEVPGPPATAFPGADAVVVGGLRGGIVALAADDGRRLWRTSTSPVSVVVSAGDRVVARVDAGIAAYDAQTGEEVWRRHGGGGGTGAPLQTAGDRLLVVEHAGTSRVVALADGRLLDEPRARDVELTSQGLVQSQLDELRFDGRDHGWVATVATGNRPALWTDADDDVVVAVVGWGHPPTRD